MGYHHLQCLDLLGGLLICSQPVLRQAAAVVALRAAEADAKAVAASRLVPALRALADDESKTPVSDTETEASPAARYIGTVPTTRSLLPGHHGQHVLYLAGA